VLALLGTLGSAVFSGYRSPVRAPAQEAS
jgi:hypothetical protein